MKRTKKRLLAALCAAAMLAGLAACGTGSEPSSSAGSSSAGASVSEPSSQADSTAADTITLTDNAGRTVELPYPVETAAVANRYGSELIRACGAIDRVVAVDLNTAQDREYWAAFDPGNVIGKGQRELDYEKIAELAPQVLILPDNGSYEEAEEKLAPFGIKVFVISGYATADFKNQTENIGKMFGVEEQAKKFYDYFNDKLTYISEQLVGQPKRTLYLETTTPYNTPLRGDPFFDMIEFSGAENIFGSDTTAANGSEIDPEEVVARNPDCIIKVITPSQALAGTGLYEPPTRDDFIAAYNELKARPGWEDTKAFQNNDVFFMTQFGHGGASKLVGTMYIAKWLYPDLLPDLDPDEVFRAWMEDFQGFRNIEGHFYCAEELLG